MHGSARWVGYPSDSSLAARQHASVTLLAEDLTTTPSIFAVTSAGSRDPGPGRATSPPPQVLAAHATHLRSRRAGGAHRCQGPHLAAGPGRVIRMPNGPPAGTLERHCTAPAGTGAGRRGPCLCERVGQRCRPRVLRTRSLCTVATISGSLYSAVSRPAAGWAAPASGPHLLASLPWQ